MLHAMWQTVRNDAFAMGLAAVMIGIILWLPFMGLLAMLVHALAH
jgi:hypothetical protein